MVGDEAGRGKKAAEAVRLLAAFLGQRPQVVGPFPGRRVARVRVAEKPELHGHLPTGTGAGTRPRTSVGITG